MTYTDVTKQSPETQAAIEREVRLLLKVSHHVLSLYYLPVTHWPPPLLFSQDSYDRAKNILKTYSKEHKILADALLRYETLDAKEIQMVLEGKSLDH